MINKSLKLLNKIVPLCVSLFSELAYKYNNTLPDWEFLIYHLQMHSDRQGSKNGEQH